MNPGVVFKAQMVTTWLRDIAKSDSSPPKDLEEYTDYWSVKKMLLLIRRTLGKQKVQF